MGFSELHMFHENFIEVSLELRAYVAILAGAPDDMTVDEAVKILDTILQLSETLAEIANDIKEAIG